MIKRVRSHHLFMTTYLRDLLRELFRPAMIFLLFLSFTFIILGASGFYYLEFGENPKILKFLDSIYYVVTIFTGVGLGDIVPITDHGRILSMVLMFIGTSIYVSFAGVVAATVLALESSRGNK